MIESEIANIAFSHLSSIGLLLTNKPKTFKPSNTIRASLLESEVKVISKSYIEAVISVDDYLESLLSELHFGSVRIDAQCKNVDILKKQGAQPAWIIVTAYYAAYFMAVEISKASGRFVLNLNNEDLTALLKASPAEEKKNITIESNNTFFVLVEHGEFQNQVKLRLTKSGAKTHQMTWTNFKSILGGIKNIDDQRFIYLDLIKNVLTSEANGWELPSNIRNDWNYSSSSYFGSKGIELAKTFSSIISSSKSTFAWASKITLKPNQENIPASISYVYYLLQMSHSKLLARLKL